MQRLPILHLLDRYQPWDAEEAAMHQRLMQFINEHNDCFQRSLQIGHVTGSAWIVNEARDKVLMLHHRKLDRWLQPGGHSDGNPDTQAVALREAEEETGLKKLQLQEERVFDIDIHTIPARKDEPQHEHFDVRFLIIADEHEPLQISEESNELAWIAIDDIPAYANERSILRMVEKTRP